MKTKPISLKEARITGKFWSDFIKKIRTKTIPYQWEALNDRIVGAEPSYCMKNFKIAAGKETGKFGGFVFQDSDLAKWLEAVAYSLMNEPHPELEAIADGAIDDVVAAQQPDGYLNTYYIINGLEKRFTNLRDNHELYCLGHFIEAAVAYYKATGKSKLLDAMVKFVELVDSLMGTEDGKLRGYPGHQEIELALVKLYGVTKNEKHLRLAKYFIDERGKEPLFFDIEEHNNKTHHAYHQSHLPVRKQEYATGHSVRALYMYAGMADVARETGDTELIETCRRLWEDVTRRQMYITGGVGATHHGEAFSFGYDLPNDTVYAETCASIALAFFAERMLNIELKGEYADVMERALYNGIISGMSADGESFFYVNPLEVVPESSEKDPGKRHVKVERQKWFGCSCCPPNLSRIISSLASYAYSVSESVLYVNLYAESFVDTAIDDARLKFKVITDYPWDETIKIKIEKIKPNFKIALRLPSWRSSYRIRLNNGTANFDIKNGYIILNELIDGDEIEFVLHMPIIKIEANPKARENVGKLAVMRGPIVYCLEEVDNGKDLHYVFLPEKAKFNHKFEKDFFDGAVLIESTGKRLIVKNWDEEDLYRKAKSYKYKDVILKWVPYYLWANRKAGEMTCWVKKTQT